MAAVTVGCGCTVDVDHTMGERRVWCTGGGKSNQLDDDGRLVVVTCRGGVAHVVTAIPRRDVVYTTAALPVPDDVAEEAV